MATVPVTFAPVRLVRFAPEIAGKLLMTVAPIVPVTLPTSEPVKLAALPETLPVMLVNVAAPPDVTDQLEPVMAVVPVAFPMLTLPVLLAAMFTAAVPAVFPIPIELPLAASIVTLPPPDAPALPITTAPLPELALRWRNAASSMST